jgi:YfiR/HmsC-like
MGVVNFVLRDNRVRFEIDENAASEDGLTISSKLLQLAVRVRPQP